MTSGDGLGDGRHPHQIGTEDDGHLHLCRSLVGGTQEPGIHTFGQADTRTGSDAGEQGTKFGVVEVGEVREPRSESRVVRPHQGVPTRQVEVVPDHHQVPGLQIRSATAGGVGEDDRVTASRHGRADPEHDLIHPQALVGVGSTFEHEYPYLSHPRRVGDACVAGDCRPGEPGELAVGDVDPVLEGIDERAQTGAEDHRHIVAFPLGTLGDGRCGPLQALAKIHVSLRCGRGRGGWRRGRSPRSPMLAAASPEPHPAGQGPGR